MPSSIRCYICPEKLGRNTTSVEAAGKIHEFGLPHVHVWAGIVVEAVGKLEREATDLVEQHVKETDSATKLMTDVLYLRAAPAYGGKHVKIHVPTTEKLTPMTDCIFQAFRTQGGGKKNWTSPERGAGTRTSKSPERDPI